MISAGDANIINISCRELSTRGSTGDISISNIDATGSISIVRSTGDVEIKQGTCAYLSVKTDTGNITVSSLDCKKTGSSNRYH